MSTESDLAVALSMGHLVLLFVHGIACVRTHTDDVTRPALWAMFAFAAFGHMVPAFCALDLAAWYLVVAISTPILLLLNAAWWAAFYYVASGQALPGSWSELWRSFVGRRALQIAVVQLLSGPFLLITLYADRLGISCLVFFGLAIFGLIFSNYHCMVALKSTERSVSKDQRLPVALTEHVASQFRLIRSILALCVVLVVIAVPICTLLNLVSLIGGGHLFGPAGWVHMSADTAIRMWVFQVPFAAISLLLHMTLLVVFLPGSIVSETLATEVCMPPRNCNKDTVQ